MKLSRSQVAALRVLDACPLGYTKQAAFDTLGQSVVEDLIRTGAVVEAKDPMWIKRMVITDAAIRAAKAVAS